jgi:sentrin-specific protease 1
MNKLISGSSKRPPGAVVPREDCRKLRRPSDSEKKEWDLGRFVHTFFTRDRKQLPNSIPFNAATHSDIELSRELHDRMEEIFSARLQASQRTVGGVVDAIASELRMLEAGPKRDRVLSEFVKAKKTNSYMVHITVWETFIDHLYAHTCLRFEGIDTAAHRRRDRDTLTTSKWDFSRQLAKIGYIHNVASSTSKPAMIASSSSSLSSKSESASAANASNKETLKLSRSFMETKHDSYGRHEELLSQRMALSSLEETTSESLPFTDASVRERVDKMMLEPSDGKMAPLDDWNEEVKAGGINLDEIEAARVRDLVAVRHVPLSTDEEVNARTIVRGPSTREMVVDKFSIDMTREKIVCLRPGVWLNDEVLNFYMSMLQERDGLLCAADPKRIRSHFFNSFFMERLLETDHKYCFKNVQRWSKKFDAFSLDKIFFPINIHNMHWTMAVIKIRSKQILYFDSMYGDGKKYLNGLLQWLDDEARSRGSPLAANFDRNEWTLKFHGTDSGTPRQNDGSSCGVFSILCADFMSDDLPITEASYSQDKIDFFRVKIAAAILRGSLDYPV